MSTAGRYVALIRGINVGRAKRVAMADLRTLFDDLGYRDVRTLLNSGNVVFTVPGTRTADAASRIERAMADHLNLRARVFVLTSAEIAAIVARNPLAGLATNPSRLLVTVLGDPRDRLRLRPLLRQDWAPEALALGPRVAYLWCPESVLASRVAQAVNRVLGESTTARNWVTFTRLQGMLGNAR